MKKEEIIKLNDKEYTLQFNRESFLKIDMLCNVSKSMQIIHKPLYKFYDNEELTDDFDFSKLEISDEQIEKEIELKTNTLKKLGERAFLVWLKPNHNLNISDVKEILKPYWEDEEKSAFIGSKIGEFLRKCVEIRDEYNEERKNLKAQTNKE